MRAVATVDLADYHDEVAQHTANPPADYHPATAHEPRRKLTTHHTTTTIRPAVWPGHTQPALEEITVTETLTPEHEEKIRNSEAAATAGPWTVELEQCDCSDGLCGHGTYVAAIYADGERRSEFDEIPDADWQFIVRARTAVPTLLAEIDRLRVRIAEQGARAHRELASAAESKQPPMDPVHILGIDQPADRVVAYRSNGGRLLRCLEHAPQLPDRNFRPVTAEELEDGGICTHPDCGRDVLA